MSPNTEVFGSTGSVGDGHFIRYFRKSVTSERAIYLINMYSTCNDMHCNVHTVYLQVIKELNNDLPSDHETWEGVTDIRMLQYT